eukprot:scaffold5080_cov159-Ochromonas_danica.AAC.1
MAYSNMGRDKARQIMEQQDPEYIKKLNELNALNEELNGEPYPVEKLTKSNKSSLTKITSFGADIRC